MGPESNGNGAGPPDGPPLRPTERRLYAALAAGVPVRADELRGLLDDELAGYTALPAHLSNLRRKIRPHGEDVVNRQVDGAAYYVLIRLTGNPYRG